MGGGGGSVCRSGILREEKLFLGNGDAGDMSTKAAGGQKVTDEKLIKVNLGQRQVDSGQRMIDKSLRTPPFPCQSTGGEWTHQQVTLRVTQAHSWLSDS